MSISDVRVVIDIERPASLAGLGTPLLLVKSDDRALPYKQYLGLSAIASEFDESSEVYKMAAALLNQGSNSPEKIAIAGYGFDERDEDQELSFTAKNILTVSDALNAYFFEDWHFIHLVGATTSELVIAGEYIDGKDFKFLAVSIQQFSELAQLKGQNRTILFYHPNTSQYPAEALVGAVGSRTVGSVTYKFKRLSGITPQPFDADDLNQIHSAGAIAYVTKAGDPQTSEGKTASGEYIDVLHGKDWIKANIETQIQRVFSASGKIPYTNDGISQLETVVDRKSVV